ncbi:uncharacterized protein QYS62_003058 [Fusarium acuminatum]|uniref:Zn(2)-C6 fungal-type domain-containing protein n=1 Tax=Fusarium acuminatum TaxID=5515 RepID=A0ABZ2WP96_9HYPO
MSARANAPKKVRLACRRCRVRRIKCDGQVPACTNCAKAGQVCLDVDSQNSDVVIPRNFVVGARERIRWLEDIIRERLPDVDLRLGPQVETAFEASATSQDDRASEEADIAISTSATAAPPASRKRSAEVATQDEQDESFSERAHSVAMNLGMLSLNIDSPQKHYLGSSSGLLFTNLIGASPPSTGTTPQEARAQTQASDLDWHDDVLSQELTKKHHRELYRLLKEEMPSKHNALILVHTYVRWIHPDFPFLDPSSLFSAIEAIYSCLDDILESEVSPQGWPSLMPPFVWNGRTVIPGSLNDEGITLPVVAFIIFMVLNLGALVKLRSRNYDFPPQRFYRAALNFSKEAFSHVTLSSIQSLITLIMHSLLTPAEVNLWTLVHLGLAYCVEIGIHREQGETQPDDLAMQQIRRFTFFTIYSLDRSISSIQGRPLGFRDETFDVKMPQVLLNDNNHTYGPLPSSFMTAVTHYSAYHFRLDRIISDIKLHLYHLPSASSWFSWPENPTEQQTRIKVSLQSWWAEVSQDPLDFSSLDNRQREVWRLKLKLKYHTAMVLLFQPSQVIRQPSAEGLQICFNSAASILDGYQRLHDIRSLHFGWRAVQNIFAAGATLIYSFWTCPVIRKTVLHTAMSRNLRNCSTLLTIGGEWWPSARDGQASFGSVADLTMRRLYMESVSNKAPRLSQHQAGPDRHGDLEDEDRTEHSMRNKTQLSGNINEAQLSDSNSVSAWQGLDLDAGETTDQFNWPAIEDGFDPEIELFLADFTRSDFTWSFPLNNNQDTDAFGPNSH